MTTAVQLISKLGSVGVKLWLDEDGQLRFKAPKGALTPELRNDLVALKEEVIAFLQEANSNRGNSAISRIERESGQTYELSFAQQRFWFLDRLEPGNPSLHIPATLHISGVLDIDCLRQAFAMLAERHESLRTVLVMTGTNGARQQILPASGWDLNENIDLSHLPPAGQQEHIRLVAEEESLRPFDLYNRNIHHLKTPMIRTRLARLSETGAEKPEYVLFLTMHHIISDGWSTGVLVNDLALIYQALRQGKMPDLQPLDIQYIDFAQWQRRWMQSERMKNQLAYWKAQLHGVPVLELPTDFPRPKQTTHHGANHTFSIDSKNTLLARQLGLSHNISLFTVLLATFNLLLSRYSNQRDICTGTPVAGRNHRETEPVIGCFINLLAIRSKIDPGLTVSEFLACTQKTLLDAQENQDIPFELVAEECVENRSLAHTPVFQVLFTHQQTNLLNRLPVDDICIELMPQPSLTSKYDLQLHINETEAALEANIEFNTDLFTREMIRDFSRHYGNLLSMLCRRSDATLLSLTPFDRQDMALLTPNRAARQFKDSLTELFERNKESPRPAVRCGDKSLTHRELHQRANALALILAEKAVGPGQRVGICLHPGIDFMVAMLATIKCGACYVPMDASYPDDRLRHMANNADMSAVITHSSLAATHSMFATPLLIDRTALAGTSRMPDASHLQDNLLYLIYTSGSTGLPKGAGVSYGNELNLLHWYIDNYRISPEEKILVISSIGFDLTQKNLLAPLACGAEIVFSPSSIYDPQVILDTIAANSISWINCAPSAFYPLVETAIRIKRLSHLASVRHLLFGGEPIQLENLSAWTVSSHFHAKITNMYGPTECTDITCAYTIGNPGDFSGKPIPIGHAIDGVNTFILNEQLQPVPVGTSGELFIGGASVGLGYFHTDKQARDNINASSFIKNPFGEGLIYRTRDLVRSRRTPEGLQLEFLGRIDDQVKIRGFRVELGEISSQLMQLDCIRDALVISSRQADEAQRLIAYYIPATNDSIDLHALRSHLKAHLPDYMIPGCYVAMGEWPLSPNGKIDKKALPEPGPEHSIQSAYVAPRSLAESQLVQIWQQALSIETIGVHDNFFELGGHSLIATRLVGQISTAFGIDLPLKLFFEKPTIAEMAELLERGENLDSFALRSSITPIDRSKPIPLSPAQERLWVIEQLNPGTAAYNIPVAISLKGPLDATAFTQAVHDIVARHETLRTRIQTTTDGIACQIITEAGEFCLAERDLGSSNDAMAEVQDIFNREASRPFVLDKNEKNEPLFRAQLIRISAERHVFIACMHHMVADGWSLTIFQKELAAFYHAYVNRQEPALEPLPHQYADFAVWQRQYLGNDHIRRHLEYWIDRLHDAPPCLLLPTDRPRPPQQTFNGAIYATAIDSNLTKKLVQFAKNLGTTPFTILLGAFALLLSKHTHQQDICIGTPVSGRERASLQQLIGYFVNAVVIRNNLAGNPTFTQFLERTQDATLGAFAHQDVPIEQVLEKLPLERNLGYPPVAQVGFSYISNELADLVTVDGLEITTIDFEKIFAKYELTMIVASQSGQLDLNLEYNSDLFDAATIRQYCNHFILLLEQCISAPETAINNISLLSGDALFAAVDACREQYEEILPLTPMQKDMVMAQFLQPRSLANTLGYRAELGFEVDAMLWQQAVNIMAAMQPVTRTQFRQNRFNYGDFAYQCILKSINIHIDIMDYRDELLTEEEINRRVDAFIYQPAQYAASQFIRYGLMRLQGNRTILLLSSHHALLDGISIVLIAETTARYYEALYHGHDLESLPALPKMFPEYIDSNRLAIDCLATQDFWRERFRRCEAPDFALSQDQAHLPHQIVKRHSLDNALWLQLKTYCRKNAMTPAQLLKLLYSILIANYCRTDADFYISEFNAGRNSKNATSIGCFFLQTPFIFDNTLMQAQTPVSELFLSLKDYRKQIKAFDNISLGMTRKLAPQGRLHFMYNYYHFFPQNQTMLGHPITCIETPPFIEQAVQMVIKEHQTGASLDLYYQSNCFKDFDLLERMELLCSQLVSGAQTIGDLSLLLPPESIQQLSEWNNPDIKEHEACSVQQLFEQQVLLSPDSIAITDDLGSITYRQLNERANRIAHFLHRQGVGADTRVGLCMPRNCEAITIILGIIKSGGAYVPIDSGYPDERIQYMLASANIDILFTESCLQPRLASFHGTVVPVDDSTNACLQEIYSQPAENPQDSTEPEDMLYVIFTSGSTGKPKGATVTHKGEINLLQWYTREFCFNADTRCLIISALGFDLTQKNLLAPLVSGGHLILSQLEHYDSGAIHNLVANHGITHINCAPSAFYPLVEDHNSHEKLTSLRLVIFGGENIKTERLARWLESGHFHAEIINNYGPTECTDIASFYRLDNPSSCYNRQVPIGRPNDNVQVFILNGRHQLLPAGLTGEICIGGSGVGRGYLHNDELNHERFIANPFGHGQLYCTGDLGRYLPDGNIDFVMRKDFQVKINGLRIELGEIESALRGQPGINDALVIVDEEKLIAYAICEEGITSHNWSDQLRQLLPAYMVPGHFVILRQWPLTPNGKIDRNALPKPDSTLAAVEYIAPRDETEQVICDIVRNILQLERVGIHDNFFDLGGHSLAASRAIVQIREHFRIDIPLNILFEMTTVEKLAAYIKASQWASQSAESRDQALSNRDTGFI